MGNNAVKLHTLKKGNFFYKEEKSQEIARSTKPNVLRVRTLRTIRK